MRTNTYITLWHREDDGVYTRRIYRARVFYEERLVKGGMKQTGYHSGSRATVRIPLDEMPQAVLGDYVRPGRCYDTAPRRIDDLKVTKVIENNLGANPHLRLFVGRASERS